MRSLRSVTAPAALGAGLALSLTVLSGCGGDGGSDEDPVAPEVTSAASAPASGGTGVTAEPGDAGPTSAAGGSDPGSDGEPALPLIVGERCTSTVEITGALEKSWKADGAVSLSHTAPVATYQSADGATVLTLYAAGKGFTELFVLAEGVNTFSAPLSRSSGDIRADGSGASLDIDAASQDGSDVHVTAAFSC